jgi:RNA polymerase sigma-70 factor (ECF subfamily)
MAPTTLILVGIAFALLATLAARRAERFFDARATDGAPWGPSWCASEGNGSPGGPHRRAADDPTIAAIWAFRPAIIRWVIRRGVPAREAEDLAQTIIESAWRSRRRWDPESCSLHWWLYVIMCNHAHTYRNRASRRRETPVADPPGRAVRREDPEAALEQKELCERTLATLDRMPPHLAAVWLHYEVEQVPASVNAEELGTPLSTVWGQLGRARGIIARDVARENVREARAMTPRRGRSEPEET